ncbi:MAG: alpha/beta hydrolase [Pseudomonadota bacterium]
MTISIARVFLLAGGVIIAMFLYLWANDRLTVPSVLQGLGKALSEQNINVTYNQIYGSHKRHKLDIYLPQKTNTQRADTSPIVIFYYGGGWRSGERGMYHFVGAALASRGITTVIPDYRLFPDVKFPAFVEDAALAYQWVWENLVKNNKNKRKIIVMGHSAGAHIAALLALDTHYLQNLDKDISMPDGLIGLAGPYAFNPTTWPRTKPIFSHVKDEETTRPIAYARKNAPSSLLIHGTDDGIVKPWNTNQLIRALNKAGAKSQKIELKDIGHFGIILSIARPFRWRAPVLERMTDFITRFRT